MEANVKIAPNVLQDGGERIVGVVRHNELICMSATRTS
jgi:hypothetical protein